MIAIRRVNRLTDVCSIICEIFRRDVPSPGLHLCDEFLGDDSRVERIWPIGCNRCQRRRQIRLDQEIPFLPWHLIGFAVDAAKFGKGLSLLIQAIQPRSQYRIDRKTITGKLNGRCN